jgi:hypothetical protein
MGPMPKGAEGVPDVPPAVKKAIQSQSKEAMTIPPAPVKAKQRVADAKPLKAMSVEAKKEELRTIKVSTAGGAAAKLLPESADDDKKDETSSKPLLSDNDARCYAARFSDLKGNSGLTHYATVGVPQGRLGTCAKQLTNYEA